MPAVVLMPGAPLTGAIGAYGKMPSQGDFLQVDLPGGFRRVWDGWLQRSLPGARRMLGARWRECYYSAPIWRFTALPGVVVSQALAGVMMPSVDRVGRAFPLTLVAPIAAHGASAEGHLAQGPFFAALEEVALAALEDSMTIAGLGVALRALLSRARTGALPPLPPEAQSVLLTRGVAPQCQWSSQLDIGVVHLKTPGLPDATTLAQMFDPAAPFWKAEAAE